MTAKAPINSHLERLRSLLGSGDIAGSVDALCEQPGEDQDVIGRQFFMDHLGQTGPVYCQTVKFYRERMHGPRLICGPSGSSRTHYHFVPRNSLLIGISTGLQTLDPFDWENIQPFTIPVTIHRAEPISSALEAPITVTHFHVVDAFWTHMGYLMEPIPGGQMVWVTQGRGEDLRVELELLTVLGQGRRRG